MLPDRTSRCILFKMVVAHEQASRITCEISTIHGPLQCLSLLCFVVEQFQTDAVWNLGKEINKIMLAS